MDSRTRVWTLVGLLAVIALSVSPLPCVAAQEAQQPPAMSPEEQAVMEKWNAYITPGEEHKVLAQRAGNWTMRVTMWMAPGAPPQVSEGTSEARMIMGGRYLEDVTAGTADGRPFEGRGFSGFDNLRKKFVFAWLDNMRTGIMVGEGAYDAKTRTFTSLNEGPDLMTGKVKKIRGVDRMIDADHWKSEMYDKTPDGKEFKMMEIEYTRKK